MLFHGNYLAFEGICQNSDFTRWLPGCQKGTVTFFSGIMASTE